MKEKIEQIINLCNCKCLDKQVYIDILDSMELPIPHRDRDDIRFQLQQHMKNDRLMAESNDDFSRLYLGERWLYWNLWRRIRELGIGHLSCFYIFGSSFFAEINLSLGLHKRMNETDDSFKERNKLFIESTKYQHELSKLVNSIKIVDNDFNLNILKDELSKFIKFDRYEISSRNGCFNKISVYADEIIPFDYDDEKVEFGLASIEQMRKNFISSLDALQTAEAIQSLTETANGILASTYYAACGILNHSNSYTKCYEEKILYEKKSNMETQQLVDKIGESVSQDELFNTYKRVNKSFVRHMARKYCLHVSLNWDQGLKFTGTFNRDCCLLEFDYEEDIKGEFDSIANNTDWEYNIPSSKVEFVQKVLESDGIEDICFKISHGNIQEISGAMRNMKTLKSIVEGDECL